MQKDKNERKITLSNLEFVLIVLIGAILGAGITFFVNPISNTIILKESQIIKSFFCLF